MARIETIKETNKIIQDAQKLIPRQLLGGILTTCLSILSSFAFAPFDEFMLYSALVPVLKSAQIILLDSFNYMAKELLVELNDLN